MKKFLVLISFAMIGAQSMVAMNPHTDFERTYGSPEEQEQMDQRRQEVNEGYARQALSKGQNLYQILGVSSNATQNEIQRAHRALARRYHPDSRAGNAQSTRIMQRINHAYDILRDPAARAAYDRTGIAPMAID